jgi:primosomal protein N'
VESKPSFTNAEWRHLVQAQDSIKEEEEKLLAKLMHLRKQERLLHHHANEFLAHDFKEVKELERLEEQERFEKEQLANHQREDASNAAHLADPQLTAVDDITFSQLIDDPFFWANVDLSTNNIAAQVGGSPSGSQ